MEKLVSKISKKWLVAVCAMLVLIAASVLLSSNATASGDPFAQSNDQARLQALDDEYASKIEEAYKEHEIASDQLSEAAEECEILEQYGFEGDSIKKIFNNADDVAYRIEAPNGDISDVSIDLRANGNEEFTFEEDGRVDTIIVTSDHRIFRNGKEITWSTRVLGCSDSRDNCLTASYSSIEDTKTDPLKKLGKKWSTNASLYASDTDIALHRKLTDESVNQLSLVLSAIGLWIHPLGVAGLAAGILAYADEKGIDNTSYLSYKVYKYIPVGGSRISKNDATPVVYAQKFYTKFYTGKNYKNFDFSETRYRISKVG